MITVSVLINGKPLITRSVCKKPMVNTKGETLYVTDAGDKVYHKFEDRVIVLAKKILDTVKLDEISKPHEMRQGVLQ